MNGPALSSHAERTEAEVDFLKHRRVVKCLTTQLDVEVSISMASNSEWKEDNLLENDLRKYVGRNFKRSEIIDFVQRDFSEYTWSTATLDTSVYIIAKGS